MSSAEGSEQPDQRATIIVGGYTHARNTRNDLQRQRAVASETGREGSLPSRRTALASSTAMLEDDL